MILCDECAKPCAYIDENYTESGGALCPECRSKKDKNGLSYDMKRAYLSGGGNICLFCKSDDLDGGPVQIDSNHAWQNMGCLNCDREWQDIYTLTDVEVNL